MTDRYDGNQVSIERYLANRLSDAEREVVETRIVGEPDFRHEVELTEALRDGLRELERQGKVGPLLKTNNWMWRRSPYAIAAAITALALGLAAILLNQRLDRVPGDLVVAPDKLVVVKLRFEQTRGGGDEPDVIWQRTSTPALLDMQFDVGLEPAAGYVVRIERIRAAAAAPVLQANAASVSADGVASFSIQSSSLERGEYRIYLDPRSTGPMKPEPMIYTLRITD